MVRPLFRGDYWSWFNGNVGFKKRQYNRNVRRLFKKWTKEIMEDADAKRVYLKK